MREFPFQIDAVRLPDKRVIKVVRDDLVPGGSKQRALVHLLRPGEEYVYPAPVFGFAQIALALVCKEIGAKATLFVAKRAELHPRTIIAKRAGAKIVQVPFGMLSVTTARARAYAERRGAQALLKGFDTPDFVDIMAEIADLALARAPKEVWCCVGTGALARALHKAWPNARFNCVQTGMRPALTRDMRLFVAPESYAKDARIMPPFPSCSNSDAKTWRFILEHASDGALFWNVAA